MEYSKPLMQRLAEKLDLDALRVTLADLKWEEEFGVKPLPESPIAPEVFEDEDFLMNLHDICCKRHITEGALLC